LKTNANSNAWQKSEQIINILQNKWGKLTEEPDETPIFITGQILNYIQQKTKPLIHLAKFNHTRFDNILLMHIHRKLILSVSTLFPT